MLYPLYVNFHTKLSCSATLNVFGRIDFHVFNFDVSDIWKCSAFLNRFGALLFGKKYSRWFSKAPITSLFYFSFCMEKCYKMASILELLDAILNMFVRTVRLVIELRRLQYDTFLDTFHCYVIVSLVVLIERLINISQTFCYY